MSLVTCTRSIETSLTHTGGESKMMAWSPITCDIEMKIQISGINISTGLWYASKTFVALLRASCFQFEVCHGWFSMTGNISAPKEMRAAADMSPVFMVVLKKKGSISQSGSIQYYILNPENNILFTNLIFFLLPLNGQWRHYQTQPDWFQ